LASQAGTRPVKKKSVVVGIPAYNEEKYISKVILKASKHCDEVVVVDDGSQDMTAEIALKMGAKVITHSRNMGKGEAMRTLFKYAKDSKADVLVTIDGDGQHDADEIPKLVEIIRSGADVAVGSRFLNRRTQESVPGYRALGNKILNSFTLSEKSAGISDTQCGFRAYKASKLDALMPSEMGMGVDSEILMKAKENNLVVKETSVAVAYGEDTSTYNPVFHTLDVVASTLKLMSIRHPLMFYGLPGGCLFVAGTTVGSYAAVEYLTQRYVSFVLSFLSITLIVSGLLSMFTGLILFTLTTMLRNHVMTDKLIKELNSPASNLDNATDP
jgi:glycosyltransferase involved in cell wall biosynthesis